MTQEEFGRRQKLIPTELLLVRGNEWIDRLCKTGGSAWCLSVPPNAKTDPDMIFTEIMDRLKYWRTRCAAAEHAISESPCDPDTTKDYQDAIEEWEKSKIR